MPDKYYDLSYNGEAIDSLLRDISNKVSKTGGIAENLKVFIDINGDGVEDGASVGSANDREYAASRGFVSDLLNSTVTLDNSVLTVGSHTVNLDASYLKATLPTEVHEDPEDPESPVVETYQNPNIQLANNTILEFGTAGKILSSNGAHNNPVWITNPELHLIEDESFDSEAEYNGITNLLVSGHDIYISRDNFIKTSDLADSESAIATALASKADIADFIPIGKVALIVGTPNNGIQLLHSGNPGQILKINDNNIFSWADEKALDLNIIDEWNDDSSDDSDDLPDDAISVVSSLSYEDSTSDLFVYRDVAVPYTAFKLFEESTRVALADKATKADLENKVNKKDIGDQFTMEYDPTTKTLTIIKIK